MFITKKTYKELIESRDKWKNLAERIQQDNKEILQLSKEVHADNAELLALNTRLIAMLKTAESKVERLQEETNRYKRYYFRHDYDEMFAEVLDKLDRFIKANCIEIKDERGIKGYVTSGVHFAIAELKKKYTEEI